MKSRPETVFIVSDRYGAVLRSFLDSVLAEEYRSRYCWHAGRSDAAAIMQYKISHTLFENDHKV